MKKYQFSKQKKMKIKTLPSLDIIQVYCPKTNENMVFLKINISMAASKSQYGS